MVGSSRKKSSSQINCHFFQPLVPGFPSNFSIPRSFVKNVQVNEGEEKDGNNKIAILRDKGGRSWKIEVNCQGWQLKNGWDKFCEDHGLQIGDILVFKHRGDLVFDVLIFDPTACERDFSRLHPRKLKASTPNDCPIIANGIPKIGIKGLQRIEDVYKACSAAKVATFKEFKPKGHPYYRTFLKAYALTWGRMSIPADFVKKNDLANNCGEMILIDQRGETWQLPLNQHKGSLYIGRWRPFHKDNGLNAGDSVVFELIISSRMPVMKFYASC